jgi:membrane protein
LIATILRWPVLVALMLLALAFVYRYAPDRDDPAWRWVSPGAIVATALWIIGSAAFSFYASRFGSYGETYGSMASVVVMMLWLYITAICVILGAEVNCEVEQEAGLEAAQEASVTAPV